MPAKINLSGQELRVPVCPSTIDLPGSALRFLGRHPTERRGAIGCRWHRLSSNRRTLPVLAHLRCGDT
jgi:hypothetical protein